ncbi:MAG: VTT domain-containing protein [Candidatus Calescibacterium sp.]|nr:VTT domain-containing protein [Candidatus Calescibacterium sp.]
MFGILKRIYDWVLSWANSKWSHVALALNSFSESIFFPVPPDVLLMALCLGKPKRALYFATITSIFSVLGGIGGYILGKFFWEVTKDFFLKYVFSVETFMKVSELYNKNAFIAVFTAGFTPIPYKVFTISAGVFSINFPIFIIASLISRSARFFIVSTLIFFFGERVKVFIEKYFNIFTIIFSALLILGFIAIKYLSTSR